MLPFIIAGLTTGSVFGIAAVGLVLTYKTSGIFNFAHGALATATAFSFYFLHVQKGVSWPVAAAICVFVEGAILGLILEWVTRHMAVTSIIVRVTATVGILLLIEGGIDLLYPPGPYRKVPQFLPTHAIYVGSTPIAVYQLTMFAVGVIAVVGLTAYLRYSRMGLAMKALVDNTELLDICGTSPARVRRHAWIIGSTMASLSGVLLAPLLPLDASTLTLLVVTAFGAAAIGAFTNIPLSYLGGLIIGIGEALLQKYFLSSTGLAGGLSASLPFLLLFGLLIVAPKLRRPSPIARRRLTERWKPPVRARVGFGVALLLLFAFVPSFAGPHLAEWTSGMSYIVVFLSLGLLVRMSGQVSLAQMGFMAIGVCAFSHVAVTNHWPWLLALLFAGAVAAPIGAVLAIPAIRFPGLYLALATLGFGLLLNEMFYKQGYMFGVRDGLTIPRPRLGWVDLSSGTGYYYLVLVIAVITAAFVFCLSRSRLGRLLRAMSDSAAGLRSSGTSINVCRVLVFCLSASLAAIGGVLDGGSTGFVGSGSYDPLQSLQLFVLVVIALPEAPWYAIMAAIGVQVVPSYISTGQTISYGLTAWFGLNAIVLAIWPPTGPPMFVRRIIDHLGAPIWRSRRKAPSRPAVVIEPAGSKPSFRPTGSGLAIADLTVRFGGLRAVSDLALTAPPGRITGLIGPNGAGKTTVFNACLGTVKPARGTVHLNDRRLDRCGTAARARIGLGRTFQQMELFDSMTILENVSLGREARYAGLNPLGHLMATRRQRSEVRRQAWEAVALCGLTDLAYAPVGSLSTGQRRQVELARCVAGGFEMMLLDEPSSGLDRTETARFGETLKRLVEDRGVGIVLVEHDMSLVNAVCSHVYVIEFGHLICEGSVADISSSALVRQAYLGAPESSEPEMIPASGPVM